ncbi:MAG: hypothetical protein HY719_02855 [Planctomycetes bacterium]|nr:hypothetical protein [Planctomycetota bacterium]
MVMPAMARLSAWLTMSPEVCAPDKGDGVTFRVEFTDRRDGETRLVGERAVEPKQNPADRRLIPWDLDLSRLAGRVGTLRLSVESANGAWDWAMWVAPRMEWPAG